MRFSVYVGAGMALALAGTSALAFQEQQAGGGAPAAPAAAQPAPDAKSMDLKGMDLSATPLSEGKSAGTEVRIPGLGKLGVLPKMDFGLELLYGANETKQPDAVERETPADDLTIRGTVKHNF